MVARIIEGVNKLKKHDVPNDSRLEKVRARVQKFRERVKHSTSQNHFLIRCGSFFGEQKLSIHFDINNHENVSTDHKRKWPDELQ